MNPFHKLKLFRRGNFGQKSCCSCVPVDGERRGKKKGGVEREDGMGWDGIMEWNGNLNDLWEMHNAQ